jgi:DEAD/DEAH box helicase
MQPYLQSGDGPIVLVLAPTRELALQIKQECDKFGASSEIKNTVVYGGVPKSTQVRDLRLGPLTLTPQPVSFQINFLLKQYYYTITGTALKSLLPHQDGLLTISRAEQPTSDGSPIWCWTRPTECLTWDSNLR